MTQYESPSLYSYLLNVLYTFYNNQALGLEDNLYILKFLGNPLCCQYCKVQFLGEMYSVNTLQHIS